MEIIENMEKPEVYKDRTASPGGSEFSVLRGVYAQSAQPLGGRVVGRMSAPVRRLDCMT